MGSTTASGYPYPVGTDRVMDGDNAIQALAEAVEATVAKGGPWAAYTPVVGGVGWSLGNGVVTGRFHRVGKLVTFEAKLVIGSTTTKGTGQLTLTAPSATAAAFQPMCRGHGLDVSATARASFDPLMLAASNVVYLFLNGMTAGSVNSTSPWTWAAPDEVHVNGTYEEG